MSRKTTMIAAIAAVAVATTLIPNGREAAALAEVATNELAPLVSVEAPELVPEPIVYEAREVAQPLPAEAAVDAPAPAAPVLTEVGSLRQLIGMIDTDAPMSTELRCLAGAVYFEARGEELAGQLAVAQVVINRTEDGRFPRSYCGVVAQPGQFSFMRGSRMPSIPTRSAAWQRAVAVARIAHDELWESEAGNAVFFHARSVRPGWSRAKTRLAQIDTHIFYR
ncbi:MAG: cell wall hydrolase [Erythrobacter sp.]